MEGTTEDGNKGSHIKKSFRSIVIIISMLTYSNLDAMEGFD